MIQVSPCVISTRIGSQAGFKGQCKSRTKTPGKPNETGTSSTILLQKKGFLSNYHSMNQKNIETLMLNL